MGDFNIDLINHESHLPTKEFIDLLSANSLYPTISKPTRITSHSATLIDNIFTNNLEHDIVSGMLYSDLTDHLPIFQITNFQPQQHTVPVNIKTRKITQSSILNFQNELQEINWDETRLNTSPNYSYNYFSGILLPIYNNHFPIIVRNSNFKAGSKPWFSAGLHNSCCKKNTLYKTYLKNPTPTNKLVYTKYRNKYNYTVKLARKKYFHDKLEMQQSNLNATWSTIKTVIGSKPRTNIPTSMKDSAGCEYTDPFCIANKFNDFFVNIGHSLSKGFSSSNNQHRNYLTRSFNGSISLFPTDPFEITTIVNSLIMKNSRSEGVDGINISIVKACIDLIALPLSTIFNKSISTGICS